MINLEITVQADNIEPLAQSVEAQDHDIEGLEIQITDRPRGLGMATSTEMLVMAATFAGNVSAGVIANYFFMKLTQPKESGSTDKAPSEGIAIFIGDDMASSMDELEIIIRRKQNESSTG